MSLIFTTLVVILGCMIWVVRDRGNPGDVAMVPMAATTPMQVEIVTPPPTAAPTQMTVTPTSPQPATPEVKSAPLVHVTTDGNVAYTARDGDTVSNLAVALLGSDSKANRDAVIASNPTLQSDPDRVLYGKTYTLQPIATPAVNAPAASESATNSEATPSDAATDDAKSMDDSVAPRNLKYTAQAGDSVAVLAANLLGGDTKANRDTVIDGNASLQQNPDRLIAGKTYNITTSGALAADPKASQATVPTTQQDADEAAKMSVGRVLRYTALPGDTVSKLATVLLGSDTKANRDAIIENNRSLKLDPDHLVAGQTYWISAPTAVSTIAGDGEAGTK